MGLKSSPYNVVQGALRAKREVMGDPGDEKNAFQWDHIIENLPCTAAYDASQPFIKKVRKDGLLASELAQYVDDCRIIAATKDLAWRSSSQVAKGLCWLGLQDAARKRRIGSQQPGPWAGSVVSSHREVVTKSVTKERWTKVQHKIRWIASQVGLIDQYSATVDEKILPSEKAPRKGMIHFKTLEKFVGFLVYVAQTYTTFVPYLKGLYLTLNS